MPVIQWNINFAIGIREIDQHHKQLVDFLNATYDAFREGVPAENMSYWIEELLDYADEHFASEEGLMEEAGYPGLVQHKREHEIFRLRAKELHGRKTMLAAVEVVTFLNNWVSHHILNSDAQFGGFLDEQNFRKKLEERLTVGGAHDHSGPGAINS